MLLFVLPLALVPVAVCVLHGPIAVTLAAFKLAGIFGTAWPPVYASACHLRIRVVTLVVLTRHSTDPAASPYDG
jgi:hypothetical protein